MRLQSKVRLVTNWTLPHITLSLPYPLLPDLVACTTPYCYFILLLRTPNLLYSCHLKDRRSKSKRGVGTELASADALLLCFKLAPHQAFVLLSAPRVQLESTGAAPHCVLLSIHSNHILTVSHSACFAFSFARLRWRALVYHIRLMEKLPVSLAFLIADQANGHSHCIVISASN